MNLTQLNARHTARLDAHFRRIADAVMRDAGAYKLRYVPIGDEGRTNVELYADHQWHMLVPESLDASDEVAVFENTYIKPRIQRQTKPTMNTHKQEVLDLYKSTKKMKEYYTTKPDVGLTPHNYKLEVTLECLMDELMKEYGTLCLEEVGTPK